MYVRLQRVRQGGRVYEYVHIVEGYRDDEGKVRHRVVANLGRRDRLKASGALDNLAGAFTRLDPAPGRYLVGPLPLVAPEQALTGPRASFRARRAPMSVPGSLFRGRGCWGKKIGLLCGSVH